MNKLLSCLGFDPAKHSVRTELMAGAITFLTMSYILAVNPMILSAAGMDRAALFSATVVAAIVGTLVMAFYAKLPFALASGMGLNAFFAYTLVLQMGYSWQQALAAVFFEGVVFILLTAFKVREAIVDAIPLNLRYAISVGIGLFIAYIGMKSAGIVVGSEATLTALGPWTPSSLLAVAGVVMAGALMAFKVRGALFYTIICMTVIGIPLGITNLPDGFSIVSMPASMEPTAFHLDFSRFLSFDFNYLIVVFTLLFMDLFDTLGTLIGVSSISGMADPKTGNLPRMNRALMADAVATTAGALCGTTTVTTYVESATGIVAGGRTGLTSLTVALLFAVALFFSPIFLAVPAAATTCALVIVGVLMMKPMIYLDLSDITEALPAFVTIVIMPLTASISEGIVLGFLSYVAVKVVSGRFSQLSPVMYVLALFFVLKYIVN